MMLEKIQNIVEDGVCMGAIRGETGLEYLQRENFDGTAQFSEKRIMEEGAKSSWRRAREAGMAQQGGGGYSSSIMLVLIGWSNIA